MFYFNQKSEVHLKKIKNQPRHLLRPTSINFCQYCWNLSHETVPLKVDGNKKQWGPGRRQMLGNGLGPWRSRFIFSIWTCSFEKNVLFPFLLVTAKRIGNYFINKRYVQNFGASKYSHVINLRPASCANGNADQIRSANYEPDLTLQIFFLFGPHLFLRSEHSVRK